MRVPVSYELDPNYPLLESLYGKKDAIKILQSGIPINRPSVVPSLQVPSESGSGCNPLSLGATSMGKARISRAGMGDLGVVPLLPLIFIGGAAGWSALDAALNLTANTVAPPTITLPSGSMAPPAAPILSPTGSTGFTPEAMAERTRQQQTAAAQGFTEGSQMGMDIGARLGNNNEEAETALWVMGLIGLGALFIMTR